MPREWVLLREYQIEAIARLDTDVLAANGVEARLLVDNAGGTLPAISVVFPIRLLVAPADEALAREILDTAVEGAGDVGDDEGPEGERRG